MWKCRLICAVFVVVFSLFERFVYNLFFRFFFRLAVVPCMCFAVGASSVCYPFGKVSERYPEIERAALPFTQFRAFKRTLSPKSTRHCTLHNIEVSRCVHTSRCFFCVHPMRKNKHRPTKKREKSLGPIIAITQLKAENVLCLFFSAASESAPSCLFYPFRTALTGLGQAAYLEFV